MADIDPIFPTRRAVRSLLPPVVVSLLVLAWLVASPGVAAASTTCGASGGHTLCVTVPDTPLSGPVPITLTNQANSGIVIVTWIPAGTPGMSLIQQYKPSSSTGNYSFVWPTQKYLDASGILRVQALATTNTSVDVPVTLSNGNLADYQHSSSDWANYLPGPWTTSRDPVVAAVGDGASGEPAGDELAQKIAAAGPDLLLYLGDIYNSGTFTEDLNHYGQNAMDGGAGTQWGAMAKITQPTMGDHEAPNSAAWQDYFHGRPLYMSFRFGNVLFLDLASSGVSMAAGSAQYNWVKSILTSTTNPPPPCIVTYFQNPVLVKDAIKTSRLAMWTLLADNGGDLVLNGDVHTMIQYLPLNDQLQLPSPGQNTMVQMIAGSGGRGIGGAFTSDPRVEWSQGTTPGAVWLSLNGATAGGTPARLSWAYQDKNGSVLHTGSRDCGTVPTPAPSISGFSPSSGAVGASVTITGSHFTGVTDVRFSGTSVGTGNFTVNSDTQITATVPAGANSGRISVTTPGGTATSPGSFTVIPPPTITGFSPTSGSSGTLVTITGSGFTGTQTVTFGGGGSASFTVNSDTQITTAVPAGATTGPISVTNPAGIATSTDSFQVIATSTLTFGPDADTYVNSGSPNSKYGTATSMSVDGSPIKDLLLKFTVSGVGTGSILSAKLRLYCTDPSDAGGTFYRVADNSWQENTVTWNTAPPADTTSSIGSIGKVSTGLWYEVNLSSIVTGDGTYSMRVMSLSSNGANYSTKEGTAGFAPQLVVTVAS